MQFPPMLGMFGNLLEAMAYEGPISFTKDSCNLAISCASLTEESKKLLVHCPIAAHSQSTLSELLPTKILFSLLAAEEKSIVAWFGALHLPTLRPMKAIGRSAKKKNKSATVNVGFVGESWIGPGIGRG